MENSPWKKYTGSESSWEGKEGFKNKGLPTMLKTWGVLGALFSAGSLRLDVLSYTTPTVLETTEGASGASVVWSATSLTVGTVNTVNSFTENQIRTAHFMNYKAGLAADVIDAGRFANPIGMINLGLRLGDVKVNNSFFEYIKLEMQHD